MWRGSRRWCRQLRPSPRQRFLGGTTPLDADAGWIGEVGPGPLYGDDVIGLDDDLQPRTRFLHS